MAVAGHRVFPVFVLWLLVQLTHSGADAMGYNYIQCSRHALGGPSETKRQGDVTVQWCLAFCGEQDPAYGYGGLRRVGRQHANADCYCLNAPGPSFGAANCGRTCGGGLQCGGQKIPNSYVSVYQDVNECLTNNGGCNQTCVNSPGSFSCSCREGYNKAGTFCTDINECDTNNGGCAQHCTNAPGRYSCSCDQGYRADNTTCHDINECAIDNGGCDHTCTNKQGGYSCSCREGYLSENTTCTDIDECADADIHNCSPTGECLNTVGSFRCLPKAVDTTVSSTVTDVDGCDDSTCDQFCHSTNGGFRCYCGPGWAIMEDKVTCAEIEGIVCRSSTAPPVWMYALLGILMAVVLAMGAVIFMLWRRRAGPNNTNNTAMASRPLDPYPGSQRAVPASPAVASWEDRPTDPEVPDSQYEHIKIYTNSEAAQGVYEKVE